ncbi:unnamed protein product [Clonostachys rosea f. rosea IK726]|uniref:Uncharacterized protein n=1 Tax=Clonostachys rosea f. rosea IK726 TaxID=1349383 RepID=A0ACA9U9Y2_BIOOC|nr:unnamed protein product [Clonostachys rosea f. rosea IK726]
MSPKVALCGIYGGWSEYMGAKHLLNGFGAFGSWFEIGPIYGSRTYNEAVSWSAGERVEKKVPSMGCVVSALDVDRPIVEVRVTLVHSNPKCSVAPIAAIQFTYLDGEKMVVGPDRFSNDPICRYCDEKTSLLEETRKVPHYRHEVWSPGDKKLTKLRICRLRRGVWEPFVLWRKGELKVLFGDTGVSEMEGKELRS